MKIFFCICACNPQLLLLLSAIWHKKRDSWMEEKIVVEDFPFVKSSFVILFIVVASTLSCRELVVSSNKSFWTCTRSDLSTRFLLCATHFSLCNSLVNLAEIEKKKNALSCAIAKQSRKMRVYEYTHVMNELCVCVWRMMSSSNAPMFIVF